MRKPERLSHSGFTLWESNPEEFYLKYLAEHRPPDEPVAKEKTLPSAPETVCNPKFRLNNMVRFAGLDSLTISGAWLIIKSILKTPDKKANVMMRDGCLNVV